MDPTKSMLFGRETVQRDITEGVLADQPSSFSLVGTRWIGKTALLKHLAGQNGPLQSAAYAEWRPDRYADGDDVLVVSIDCNWAEAQQDLLGHLFVRVYDEAKQRVRFDLDETRIEAQTSPARKVWQIARQLQEQHCRLVVLMDNFDRAFEQQLIHLDSADELRPLTLEMALVVATEQPLHDLDRQLAASPLFNVMTQVFIGLLNADAANQWLDAYCEQLPALQEMRDELLFLSGTHPYLLRRIGDIIPEIRQMLTPDQELGPEHIQIFRLRLAEHGRLLFEMLWRTLQTPPPRVQPDALERLVRRLVRGPLTMGDVGRDQAAALNWMINQAMVAYGEDGYRLFSPLFREFLAIRLDVAPNGSAPTAILPHSMSNDDPIYEQLTKTEAALLRYFRANSQTIVTPQQLLNDVWNRPNATSRRVQEAIRRLRLQLEQATPPIGVIENERGRGYRFVPATD